MEFCRYRSHSLDKGDRFPVVSSHPTTLTLTVRLLAA